MTPIEYVEKIILQKERAHDLLHKLNYTNKNMLLRNLEIAAGLDGLEMYVLINKSPKTDLQIHEKDFDKLMADFKQNLL